MHSENIYLCQHPHFTGNIGTNVYFGKVVTMTLNMSAIVSIGSEEGMDTNNANAFLIFCYVALVVLKLTGIMPSKSEITTVLGLNKYLFFLFFF